MQGYSRPRLAVAAVAASAASLGGLALAAPAQAAGNNITVGGSGTYQKIADGIAHANAGDTVTVAAGTYNETLTAKAGVTVVSATPGGAQVNNIVVSGAANAVVDGFKVDGFHGYALKVAGSDGAVIKNNTITNSGLPSTTLPTDPVHGTGGTPAVSLDGAVTFSGNKVGNNVYYGITVSGAGGTKLYANELYSNADTNVGDPGARYAAGVTIKAPNVVVAGNYAHDNQDSGIQFYKDKTSTVGGDNGIAVNNVVANNHDHGIDNLSVTGGSLLNNTVFHNDTSGINLEGTTAGGYTIENNISTDNGVNPQGRSQGEIRIAQGGTNPGGVTVDHNLVNSSFATNYLYDWDEKDAVANPGGLNTTYTTPALFNAAKGQAANDKAANPAFLSATDLHIGAASPAANLASKTAANAPTTDKDGNAWAGSAGAYNAGSTGGPATPPGGTGGPAIERLGGTDRFDTGIKLSQKQFPSGAKDVVLATGWAFPDALSGVPLAKHLNAPLLLIDGHNATANAAIKTELARLMPNGGTLHVLGGLTAVPKAVVDAVIPANVTLDRLGGATRFDTSVAIAVKLGSPKNVVVARGDDGVGMKGFADALSAGPYAANVFGGGNGAVLLSNNTTLDPAVKGYLAGATSIQAVGGPAATAVAGLAHVQTSIVGQDRYDTAAQVAAKFTTVKTAGVAYGLKFPDALTGAALLATADGPLVLTDTSALPPYTATELGSLGAKVGNSGTIEVFGGIQVITEATRTAIAVAAKGHLVY
jgi:hypothetical protein